MRAAMTWRVVRASAWLLCAGIASVAQAAYVSRYSQNANGGIVFTGNALGLSRNLVTFDQQGTSGSIGAFINSDVTTAWGNYPSPTIGANAASTTLWQNNASEATLNIPAGSSVLYAELIWGGDFNSGGSNVTSSLNVPVTFSTPSGTYSVTPDSATAQLSSTRYVRSANVTGLVRLGGTGRYKVKGVPASYGADANTHAAGWTLAVVYGNSGLPARNLSLFIGAERDGAAPASVSGFCTPTQGALRARAYVSAIEGDSNITGDSFRFGPTATLGTGNRLSGPNNPANNFFAGQINSDTGALDTSGTLGSRNHNAVAGTAIAGGRQGWDITSVDASSQMQYNQTSAFAQGATTGDAYTISSLGLAIDLAAPLFNVTSAKTVDKAVTYVGDVLTYTVNIKNTGDAPSDSTTFFDTPPAGTSFVAGSVVVNGVAQPAANPINGVPVGSVAQGATTTVRFQARVNTLPASPAPATYVNSARWDYDYIPCGGRPRQSGSTFSNSITSSAVRLEPTKTVSPQGAVAPGTVLTYTISVPNTGAVASSGTTLRDLIPANTTYVAGSTRLNGNVVADLSGVMPYVAGALINNPGSAAGVINPGSSAVVQFQVTVATPSAQITNTATIDADGNGPIQPQSVTATNSGLQSPRVSKAFSPVSIAEGGVSRATITINNDNAVTLTQLAFNDTLPSGLVLAPTPNLTNSCAGTVTGGAGEIVVKLTGGALAGGNACTVAFNVTAANSGSYTNTLAAGSVSSQEAGANTTAGSATLSVVKAPQLSKSFSPAAILPGQVATLTLDITNPQANTLTSVSLTDSLPSGVKVAPTPALTNTCAGTVSAAANATSVSLSNGTVAASGVCRITVNVTAAAAGSYLNTIPAGGLSTAQGSNTVEATATLNVRALEVQKSFAPNPVGRNVDSVLTITLNNAVPTAITGVSFTDTFPSGLVIGPLPGATNNCGGTLTAAGGSGSVRLVGGVIPASGSCQITVNARAASAGAYTNTIPVGGVTSANGGSNEVKAEDTLSVGQPSVSKVFNASTIVEGGTSALTITLLNPNPTAATNVSLDDNLPTGLVASTPGGTCAGTKAASGASVTLRGGTIPAPVLGLLGSNTCTVTANITGSAGVYTNVIPPDNLQTSAGNNTEPAQAVLTILSRPVASKVFAPATISPGARSELTITLTNNNALPLDAVQLTDVLPTTPGQMRVADVVSNSCGGTLEGAAGVPLAAGADRVRLLSGGVPANGSCAIVVGVTVPVTPTSGTYTNTIPAANYSGNGNGVTATGAAAATANLVVALLPPDIAKAFSPATIGLNDTSMLTFTLTNPNPFAALAGVNFSDVFPTLPGAMRVATPLTTTNTCSGTLQDSDGNALAAGDTGIRLINGALPAGGSCTLSVRVSVNAAGNYLNTSGSVGATGTPTGNTASASLGVVAPANVSKSFLPSEIGAGRTSQLRITISNTSGTDELTGVAVSDTYPAGLLNASPSNVQTACTAGSSVTVTGGVAAGNTLSLSNGTLKPSGSCTVSVEVTAATVGSYVNTTSVVTSTNGGTGASATATLIVSGFGLSGTVYHDINADHVQTAPEAGTNLPLFVKLLTRTGATCASTAQQAATVNPSTGAYAFTGVSEGSYCLVLDTNNTLTDVSATYPAGWVGTENDPGLRSIDLAAGDSAQLNFGLVQGARLSGRVFDDNGSSGGTANNGVLDGQETGLNDVAIEVRHGSCGSGSLPLCVSTRTGSDGRWTVVVPSTSTLTSVQVIERNPSPFISIGGSAGNTGGAYVRSTDTTTFNLVPGTRYSGIDFADVRSNSFTPNNAGAMGASGVLFYPHSFVAGSAGTVTFTRSATASPAFTGWVETLYLDDCDGVLEDGETTPYNGAAISVAAGGMVCLIQRESLTPGAPNGLRNEARIDAQFTYSNASQALTTTSQVADVTVTGNQGSGLQLTKAVDKPTAKPGETLIYSLLYRNVSTEALGNVFISDVTPAYTTFIVAACQAPLPASITACAVTTQPGAGAVGNIRWDLTGSLAPGAEGRVTFSVKVDE
jgi:uncharacterized repeat protein (TIGR01451 family)